ncbi:MBOAT family O-acyltransferase [Reichenbachiella versicolor]|uniref:MBOAT family O-acyltransferase n=1 Tax=Reichenbachiella versicolor TaxID=1821036 RepID=UPI000D6E222B|nr:MBOAT family O-acyltransferase [Reichenbachiella versicolor]
MIFNSIDFAIFLPIVLTIYWIIDRNNFKLQNLFIAFTSYFFYGWWNWTFLTLIFASTIVDYLIGRNLVKSVVKRKRKLLLGLSISFNIGILLYFKYFNFFLENFTTAFSFFGYKLESESLNVILPVGISFYTFQTLSYTIDVYRKKIDPTHNFIAFIAFVSFFPQLVAGPIERASHLLPQFLKKRKLDYSLFVSGANQILWGLFKKIVIADRLAIVVNEIYNSPNEYHGFTLILATILFAFQIYCDFSGYSEIAIGTAKLFGFDLMQNFNLPYFSASLSEFWRNWHISLSTWFRDYLYIPLGGNKTSKVRWYMNILIVFIISGFWHGANWTFIIWGAIHGVALIIEANFSLIKTPKVPFVYMLKRTTTFVIVCLGWVFFRSNSLENAMYILNNIMDFSGYHLSQLNLYIVPTEKNTVFAIDIFLSILLILALAFIEYFFLQKSNFQMLRFRYKLLLYTVCIWSILVLGSFEKNEFIYFQF